MIQLKDLDPLLEDNIAALLGVLRMDVHLVGSTYALGEGKDIDVVALVPDKVDAQEVIEKAGYQHTGHDSGEEDNFTTFRKGDVNLMLTESKKFQDDFLTSTEVVKYLNLTNRDERVGVHRIIMNGLTASQVHEYLKAD